MQQRPPANSYKTTISSPMDDRVTAIRKKYASGPPRSNTNLKKDLTLLLEHLNDESILMTELQASLKRYAESNLSQIGTGNNYSVDEELVDANSKQVTSKNKRKTKPERATAVSNLFDMLKSSSAFEVYQYVTTPNFQETIGAQEYKFNILREHLASIVKRFICGYEKFIAVNQNNILLDVLLDQQTSAMLSDSQIASLLWAYNSTLVADVIVNVYKDTGFKVGEPDSPSLLTYEMLVKFLSNDKSTLSFINLHRSEKFSQLILPENARAPGKNLLAEEGLDVYQLYQYEDDTIIAIEQWIRDHYSHYFVNKIEGFQNYSQKPSSVPYYFYQISAVKYMLLDPKEIQNINYSRYQDFKKDLSELVSSYDPSAFSRPVIFGGIINIDGSHYITYFIHVQVAGQQVIIVDPSPQTYPAEELERGQPKDGKLKTRHKIQRIFEDILPGCTVLHSKANQMLRERDCGPNAATTFVDALQKPLLSIQYDYMFIDETQLTINYQPITISPYTGTFVYPEELERVSLHNRAVWRDRLALVDKVKNISLRESAAGKPFSIDYYYSKADQLEYDYSYTRAVQSQEHQDAKGMNISTVQSLLLSNGDGQEIINSIVKEYKQTMTPPNPDKIVAYIKSKMPALDSLRTLTSAHGGNLDALAHDVIILLVREHIPIALEHVFTADILSRLENKFDLNAAKIVDGFLHSSFCQVYKSLSIYKQATIKSRLYELAEIAVKQKLTTLYLKVAKDLFEHNCRNYLVHVPAELNITNVAEYLITHGELTDHTNNKFPKEILSAAIKYLALFAREKLIALINKNVIETSLQVYNSVLGSMQYWNVSSLKLEELLKYFDSHTGTFLPLSRLKFIDILSKSASIGTGHALEAKEVDSYLGSYIIAQFNHLLLQRCSECIGKSIEAAVVKLLSDPNIPIAILGNKSPAELANMLDGAGNLLFGVISNEYLEKLLVDFGSVASLTNQDFKHVLIRDYATRHLLMGIQQIVKAKLELINHDIALQILSHNVHELIVKHVPLFFSDFSSAELVIKNICEKYMQSEPGLEFFKSNFFTPSGDSLNHYGHLFHVWFITNYITPLMDNYSKAHRIINSIQNSITALENLNKIFAAAMKKPKAWFKGAEQLQPLVSSVAACVNHLHKLLTNIETCSIHAEFNLGITAIENECLQTLGTALSPIYQHCITAGDITPGSLSVLVRPLLCQLLHKRTTPLLTGKSALQVDAELKQLCSALSTTNFFVSGFPTLITVMAVNDLPETYGKPITWQLLVDCVAYWFTKRSFFYDITHPGLWFTNERTPKCIITLINLLNTIKLDENRDAAVLAAFNQGVDFTIQDENELQILDSTDIVEKIKATLQKTTTITNSTSTALQFGELVRFLSLKEAMRSAASSSPAAPVFPKSKIDELVLARTRILKRTHATISTEEVRRQVIQQLNEKEVRIKDRMKVLKLHSLQQASEATIRHQAEQDIERIDQKVLYLENNLRTQDSSATIDLEVLRREAEKNIFTEKLAACYQAKLLDYLKATNPLAEVNNETIIAIPPLKRIQLKTEAANELKGCIGSEAPQVTSFIDQSLSPLADALKVKPKKPWLSFFTPPIKLEELVLRIKKKHGNVEDFHLDEDDMNQLRNCIEKRWLELHRSLDFAAVTQYLYNPQYEDKLYIAVAEILAKFYKEKNIAFHTYRMLMPGIDAQLTKFNSAGNLPPSMCHTYQTEGDRDIAKSSVGDIPFSNLVITRSGYALDISIITNCYAVDHSLVNPYTKRDFTLEDLSDICKHPHAQNLCRKVYEYNISTISPDGLQLLINYLNAAVFDNGFKDNYTQAQDDQVIEAQKQLATELSKLPRFEQEAFAKETVPPIGDTEGDTIDSVMKISAVRCMTLQSVNLARIVLAYRGNDHGLLSAELVRRAKEDKPIIPRVHKSVHETSIDTIVNPLERHLAAHAIMLNTNPPSKTLRMK